MSHLRIVKTEQEEEEKEKDMSNIVTLGGGTPTGGDWLSRLPIGTCFLAKLGDNPILTECHVVNKWEKAVWLRVVGTDGKEVYASFDPTAFCRIYQKFEIQPDHIKDQEKNND